MGYKIVSCLTVHQYYLGYCAEKYEIELHTK